MLRAPGSKPNTQASPPSRCRKPSRISRMVVLPAPLGPSKAKISFSATEKLAPRTAVKAPYRLHQAVDHHGLGVSHGRRRRIG